MVLKVAWRNVWRNRIRSLIVMGAVVIGIWSTIFLLSFSFGIKDSYIDNAIQNGLAHIQIHTPAFSKEPELKYHIPDAAQVVSSIRDLPGLKSISPRVVVSGMAASSKAAMGIMIQGIDPLLESQVSGIKNHIKEGSYFTDRKNQILIGKKLNKKLGLKIRSKVVLTFQDVDGNITSGAFRIAGIFESNNSRFDESNVFVKDIDLRSLVGSTDMVHEIAIVANELDLVNDLKASIVSKVPDALLTQTYAEISPDIKLYEEQIKMAFGIFIFIVMLALIFGIINTMLMAVLERYKELGILMAIGMNKTKVFFMVVYETIILCLSAAPFGFLCGYLSVMAFKKRGFNLSAFSDGMNSFGMSTIIYPSISVDMFVQVAVAIVITAILAAIYPAWKAIKLDPVTAIRKL